MCEAREAKVLVLCCSMCGHIHRVLQAVAEGVPEVPAPGPRCGGLPSPSQMPSSR